MKNFKLMMIILSLFLISTAACQKSEKPSVSSKGAAMLQTAAGVDVMPAYHVPVAKWRSTHMDEINAGRVKVGGCLPCHSEPENFCNKCHEYVGAKKVLIEGKGIKQLLSLEVTEGLQPTPDHQPIGQWRTRHDEAIIYGKAPITSCLGCHFEPEKFCNRCHSAAGIRKIIPQ
ncbi:MAG: hypothetical protein QMD01_05610 [Thermodesulfovibrionales bacterium]|nr:hypothetical protein [Thermodesulfovibrionales bacterium]